MSQARARPPAPLAPWAEVVPGAPPMTVDDLLSLPDDGSVYEVVDGVLVRVAGSGDLATTIAVLVAAALVAFVRPRRLGRVTGADGVYKFPGAETGLIPDVGFYTVDRRALIVDRTKPNPFPPDLAVEVASPEQTAQDMAAKALLYLAGGTRLVWVVWPEDERIDVWRPGDTRPATTLTVADTLDGLDVVPGFTYPVADLFGDL